MRPVLFGNGRSLPHSEHELLSGPCPLIETLMALTSYRKVSEYKHVGGLPKISKAFDNQRIALLTFSAPPSACGPAFGAHFNILVEIAKIIGGKRRKLSQITSSYLTVRHSIVSHDEVHPGAGHVVCRLSRNYAF